MAYEVQRSQASTRTSIGTFPSPKRAISFALAEIEREQREGAKKVTIWVRNKETKEPRLARFCIDDRGLIEREVRK